jgi:hypothetical protein
MPRPDAPTARRPWQLLEPIHAVTHFSPEPLAELKAAGYRGFWMGYFAGRAAPLGRAGAEVVHALFYNFKPEHVARALPDAWDFAPPERAIAARQAGSTATLRRHLGVLADAATVERAADLAAKAARSAAPEGRVLFAANRSLPEADDPLTRLWHAATLLREHRDHVEQVTDELAATAYDVLTADELTELADALRPITRAVVAAGDIPRRSPMGLDLGDAVG